MKPNKDKSPDQLRHKYNRRARVAAWAAGIPGVFGGVVGAEAAFAQPAAAASTRVDVVGRNSPPKPINKNFKHPAAPERTQQAEQSSQAFIDSFDKKLVKQVELMHSSPNFTTIKHKLLGEAFHTIITIDYVWAPSKQYPGRYDWLTVLKRRGERVPLQVEVLLGSDSKSYANRTNPEFTIGSSQVGYSGELLPRSMAVLTDDWTNGSITTSTFFNVSSEGYPAPLLPADGIKYSDDPARVSATYNNLLDQIQNIVTRSKQLTP